LAHIFLSLGLSLFKGRGSLTGILFGATPGGHGSGSGSAGGSAAGDVPGSVLSKGPQELQK